MYHLQFDPIASAVRLECPLTPIPCPSLKRAWCGKNKKAEQEKEQEQKQKQEMDLGDVAKSCRKTVADDRS